ncbi:MAG: response regulator transcription factor [Terriglobales bacterium]
MFRILIADDHEAARRWTRTILEKHPGWEVCGEDRDGREAVKFCDELQPDLVLLDLGIPKLAALEGARRILANRPETRILILTMDVTEEVVREGLAAGVRGFLLKSDAGRDLIIAVEALQSQRTFFTFEVAELIISGYLHSHEEPETLEDRLTPRERQVVRLLAEGKRTREAAAALNVSIKTVETHRTNIMRKLELHSIAGLTLYAARNGIVRVF